MFSFIPSNITRMSFPLNITLPPRSSSEHHFCNVLQYLFLDRIWSICNTHVQVFWEHFSIPILDLVLSSTSFAIVSNCSWRYVTMQITIGNPIMLLHNRVVSSLSLSILSLVKWSEKREICGHTSGYSLGILMTIFTLNIVDSSSALTLRLRCTSLSETNKKWF